MVPGKQKIEDTFDDAIKTSSYDPKKIENISIEDRSVDLNFPQILDFTFPTNLPDTDSVQIGQVTYIGDGVCHLSGLDSARMDEIAIIKTRSGLEKALILGITKERVEAVVLGDFTKIKLGDPTRTTKSKL